jgi:hypothetical protein
MLGRAITLLLALVLVVPAAASGRMTIVYDEEGPAARVFDAIADTGGSEDAYRQEPGRGGTFRPFDGDHRIAKLQDEDLRGLSAERIADVLRSEIDSPDEEEAGAHMVAIDEIGNTFRDERRRPRYKTVVVRGKRYRIAEHNDIRVTRSGWKLIRRKPPAPEPAPGDPGVQLSEAMRILADEPSPWGGSYASRVHFYLAPALVTSIGLGRGQHFTLGRSGSTHIRPGWRGVFPGLALAGGVWLQMYHGHGAPVSAAVWRRAPGRLAAYLKRHGGSAERVHLVFTGSTSAPPGARGCGSPTECEWRLASRGATRRILDNGPGVYRLGGRTAAWTREYREYFSAAGR